MHYAIGDIHGCFETLGRLLDAIEFDPADDRLWLVGDLVNGGPDSLEVLRWVRRHPDSVTTVLGNHDLHMLAVASGAAEMRGKDNFEPVLRAPDADELLDWLRHRPLLVREGESAMVHAGLLPDWTIDEAEQVAGEVEAALQSGEAGEFFEAMYGNEPRRWRDDPTGHDRLRIVVNATTRMRTVDPDGAIQFDYKQGLDGIPDGQMPWFAHPRRRSTDTRLVFGHWSAIGYHSEANTHALDSGCSWGGPLSALRLEDERLFQVDSELPAVFG